MVTTISAAREAIYQRFVDNVPTGIGANYTFANEKYTAPTDTVWARVTVNHEAGEQDTLGGTGDRKFLRRGRVLIQIFDIVDNGIGNLDTLSDAVRDIFEGTSFSSLCFYSVDVRETGPDGEWYQFVVDAPFDYQEQK